MIRTIEQNKADLEIARMRLDQAQEKLSDAVLSGNEQAVDRMHKVYNAAKDDYNEIMGY